jgi:hypothetical protein
MTTLTATWSANSRTRTKIICYELSTSPSSNTSVMRADVYVNADSGWPITVDSTSFTAYINGVPKTWSFGRKTFGGGVDTYIGTHDVTVGHDVNGAGSASFRATHTGTFGGSSDTGTGSAPMTDFVRLPTAPASCTAVVNVNKTVTVTSGTATNYGSSPIYRAQVANSGDNYASWKNSAGTLDGNDTMTNRVFTYSSLTPGLSYRFRTFVVDTEGTGPTTQSINYFIPSGGKRYDTVTGTFVPTQTAKRYDTSTSSWITINTAKRYDSSLAQWVNLT